MTKLVFCVFILTLTLACKKNLDTTKTKLPKGKLSTIQKLPNPKQVTQENIKKIDNWQAYKDLSSFLERFKSTTSNQILTNSLELKDLVGKLKTSNKPEFLNKAALNARINVLLNEALRLFDMSLIPSIKNDEVVSQTLKIIDVFSSLNEKINTLYAQQKFEDNIHPNKKTDSINNRELRNPKTPSIKKEIE